MTRLLEAIEDAMEEGLSKKPHWHPSGVMELLRHVIVRESARIIREQDGDEVAQ